MVGLQATFCLLACVAAIFVTEGTLSEVDLALLPLRPDGLSTRGTEFFFAFMGNDREHSPADENALIIVTTEEPNPVRVTVEVNPAFYENNTKLDTTTFPPIRTQTVQSGSSITFEFPVAPIANNIHPDEDIRVYDITDEHDRNSGIRISTDGGKVSVYSVNNKISSTIFPCYEYPTIVGNYEYMILSVTQENRDSRLMIVGCENDTRVTITPTSQLNNIPATFPANLGGGQTPRPNSPLNITYLDQLTSIVLNGTADLSGTRIASNKPIAVFTGHNQQVPPQVTWGRLFFTVPIPGRYSGDHYRVATVTKNTEITLTCRTLANLTLTMRTISVDFNTSTKTGFAMFNTTPGTLRNSTIRKQNLQWCCIESNNPILIMQYEFGSTADKGRQDSDAVTFGNPSMAIIPPVVQYMNNYTLPTEKQLREKQFDVGYTIAIPRDDTFFRSPAQDGSMIVMNEVPIVPDPDEGWIEIFCNNGQVCGYSARVEHTSGGVLTIRHVDPHAAFSFWIYGIAGVVFHGFNAGFKLDAVGFPIVRAEDVTVLESDGVAVVTFTRTGNLGAGSRFNIRLMPGSAVSPDDYDADYTTDPTNATRNATTNELQMRTGISTVTATFNITVDTIQENPEIFFLFLEGTRRVFILTPRVTVTILDRPRAPSFPSNTGSTVPTNVVIAVVVAVSVAVVFFVIIICICWRKRRSSDTVASKAAGAQDIYDSVTSPKMYSLANRLYDQQDIAKETQEEYSQLQHIRPPPASPNVTSDPTYSQLQPDPATGGEAYGVVNKKPPPVTPYVIDDPSHSQLKQDQATGGDVYSVVNKKPPPVTPYDPSHEQDPATGGDVYSVVNKKPPPVTPYVIDDPSHSQLKQDQATGGEVNQGPPGGNRTKSGATDLL